MKKIKNFNVYLLNRDKHRAYMNEHPEAHWYQLPPEAYDIVQIEGWLISPLDLYTQYNYPKDRCDKLQENNIKFVAHHPLYDDGSLSKWWKISEYSTSASMTRRHREKRIDSITDLVVELDIHWDELEIALAKHQQEAGIINQ